MNSAPKHNTQFFCTLTGADNHVNPSDLWDVAGQFRPGLVEWGILYSESNQGTGRYPAFEWIDQLIQQMGSNHTPRFSLHVCGRAVKTLLAGVGHVAEVAQAFPRIQLNIRASEYPLDAIRSFLERNADKTIITQHNAANATLWHDLIDVKNHVVLFDQSGGRGVLPDTWPAPLEGKFVGYAGGLGLDNLNAELPRIRQAAAGADYWIDAEGKLRDGEDRFDMLVARQFLKTVQTFEAAGLVGAH